MSYARPLFKAIFFRRNGPLQPAPPIISAVLASRAVFSLTTPVLRPCFSRKPGLTCRTSPAHQTTSSREFQRQPIKRLNSSHFWSTVDRFLLLVFILYPVCEAAWHDHNCLIRKPLLFKTICDWSVAVSPSHWEATRSHSMSFMMACLCSECRLTYVHIAREVFIDRQEETRLQAQ